MARLFDPALFEQQLVAGDRESIFGTIAAIAEAEVSKRLASFPPLLDPDDVAEEAAVAGLRSLRDWEPGPGRSSALVFATRAVRYSILDNLQRAHRWTAKRAN